jgi:putative acetyltransferase
MRDPYCVVAEAPHQFETASLLFQEYAAQLGIDLCFQDFAAELKALPMMYGPPSGCLVLAMNGATPVGCGALRRLSDGVCEMKRLYIRRAARGAGLGRRLAERLVDEARILGYETMRLDTLVDMRPAQNLYRSLGFREIKAYYANPLSNSLYLELALTRAGIGSVPAELDPEP